MRLERKQDLSIYYWLKDIIFVDYPVVTVRNTFPTNDLVVPSVAFRAKYLEVLDLELGNRMGYVPRLWLIDTFGATQTQGDDLAYEVFYGLRQNNIPVYDYEEGFPPLVSPTKLGALQPGRIKLEFIDVIPELVDELYWRATISFVGKYTEV